MRENSIIKLDQISFGYKGANSQVVNILHDISLEIEPGQALSIIGASGSGKTSLMMLMAGVETPTSGQIIISGVNITNFSEDELAGFRRGRIGIVFQNFHLIPTMTAIENVEMALALAGQTDCHSKATAALKAVGLDHRTHHYPDQLSGGEQQRVAIARAFATQPKILFADEPTGNLDSENGAQIIDLLFELQEQHQTSLVLITHDMHLAEKTSRQVFMEDGRLRDVVIKNGVIHDQQ